MSVEAVLVQKSTKSIIKHGLYPRADMMPVEGLDPDYEWLIKNIPYPEPDYDPRIYIMGTNLPDLEFLEIFAEHPEYSGVREYKITYSPEKRPQDDIIRAIENAEKEANGLVFSEGVHKDESIFMMNAIHKDAKSLDLTPQEQSYVDKLSEINVKISKNLSNKLLLVSQVNANQEPNIDSGWEKN